jgi:DNA-binding NarL/FixJ family response regulator
MKLLLVDSKATRRHSVQNVLYSLGVHPRDTIGVIEPRAAIEKIKKETFGCVFIFAEEKIGYWYNLIVSIREMLDYNTLPIILLSDYPTKEQVIDAYEAGINAFLRYPCSASNIEKALTYINRSIQSPLAE